MPSFSNYAFSRTEDGIISVSISPPTPIGGWNIEFNAYDHFDGNSGRIKKSCDSGFCTNQSGITITNSGNGQFNIFLYKLGVTDASGFQYGNMAWTIERMNSGFHTVVSEGFLSLNP